MRAWLLRKPQLAAVVALILFLGGCSSARMSDHESDSLFREGRYDEAAARLKKGAEDQGEDGRDILLYLLDLGLSEHSGGKFAESTKAFLKADQIAEIKDYTSLSREGATLLTSENIKDYKGEDFEKVLINSYLAMNYALQGNYEDALVEARKVNQKLYLMNSQGGRKYEQSAFARYLSAVLYEAEGEYNDAYVDYKNAYALAPDFPWLHMDLWRTARLLDMEDEMEKWDETFHLTKGDHVAAMQVAPKSGKGELIVIYENGISPVKKPNPSFQSVPKFYPRFNPVLYADVEINGQVKTPTARLDDIEAMAIENLEEKYGGIVAKKLAGMVAKGAVGYGVAKATNSRLLGELAGWILYATDQADLRSWNLLPKDLQMARIVLDPGTYDVRILPMGGTASQVRKVTVVAGQKVFLDYRYMP